MPPPNLPPTPQSSTELLAKDLSRSSLGDAFTLPPPALHEIRENDSRPSSTSSSDSSYTPSVDQRGRARRTSTTKGSKQSLELPPPPTRSRKIIQMKVKEQDVPQVENQAQTPGKGKAEPAQIAGTKRKAAGTNSAAGRKIARKTAHSLIERRRRSKMNEEFATLKDMVPACRGHEMHKLAILQASIDYLRYLEDCIVDLKDRTGNTNEEPRVREDMQSSPAFSPISTKTSTAVSTPYPSPGMEARKEGSQTPTPIAMSPVDSRGSFPSSHQTSPMWAPMKTNDDIEDHQTLDASRKNSNSNSSDEPVELDENEATAALLMLNRDRRDLGHASAKLSHTHHSGTNAVRTNPSSTTHTAAGAAGQAKSDRRSGSGMRVHDLLT